MCAVRRLGSCCAGESPEPSGSPETSPVGASRLCISSTLSGRLTPNSASDVLCPVPRSTRARHEARVTLWQQQNPRVKTRVEIPKPRLDVRGFRSVTSLQQSRNPGERRQPRAYPGRGALTGAAPGAFREFLMFAAARDREASLARTLISQRSPRAGGSPSLAGDSPCTAGAGVRPVQSHPGAPSAGVVAPYP